MIFGLYLPEYSIWVLIVGLTLLVLGLVLQCRVLSYKLKKAEDEQDYLRSKLNTVQDAHSGEISEMKIKHKKETDDLRNKIRKLSHIEHPIDSVKVAKNGPDQ